MFTPAHQPPREHIAYCRHCGHATERRTPPDDSQARACCPACGTIHYVNPLVVVGTVPSLDDRVLLCRRNIEPRRGKWTLPAGFMELHETSEQGAARETVEEAGAAFVLGPLFSVMNVAQVAQVHLFYLATLQHDRFAPGPETIEARLFSEAEIPWDELAFLTVKHTLEAWLSDRRLGRFGVHAIDFSGKDYLPTSKRKIV